MQGEINNTPFEVDSDGFSENIPESLSRRQLLGLGDAPFVQVLPIELSRRTILRGLGATIGLIVLEGAAALKVASRSEQAIIEVASADICVGTNSATCYAAVAGLDVPAVAQTQLLETTSTISPTTLPATTTTFAVPLPPETMPVSPPPETLPPAQAAAVETPQYIREVWWNGVENPRDFIRLYLPMVPGLEQLAVLKGNQWADAAQQLAHIDWLNSQISVTPEDFYNRQPDYSRMNAFAHQPGYANFIVPQVYVYHWTGRRYDQDAVSVDGLIRGLDREGYRVANFADRNGNPFRLFDSYTRAGAHAKSLNGFASGGEYETESWGPQFGRTASPIYDFNPALVKTMILDGVEFCRHPEVNVSVDETTLISHYAGDLLFDTDSYNPVTGEIGTIDKWDPPQELITRVIIPKAQALDAALGPR